VRPQCVEHARHAEQVLHELRLALQHAPGTICVKQFAGWSGAVHYTLTACSASHVTTFEVERSQHSLQYWQDALWARILLLQAKGCPGM
jgi:hypothetical protein